MPDQEVTDLVVIAGVEHRRLQNEAANVELARRGLPGSVSGELPPGQIDWRLMTIGDQLWRSIADGTLPPAPAT